MAAETGWLAELEGKVRAAVERIDELRRENKAQAQRVQELESQLAAHRDPAAAEPGEAGEAAAWREDRRHLQLRVERLTALLEDLLAAAAEP
jgi:predicted RNase H-like nuclease (RuvC/YqgF family)